MTKQVGMRCRGGEGFNVFWEKKGVAGGGEQRYFGRNGLTFLGGGSQDPYCFCEKVLFFCPSFFSQK